MNPNEPQAAAGLSGALRAGAIISVIVLALIGVLAVLEVIPREALQEWLTKAALLIVIVAAAGIAIALLSRSGGSRS